MDLSLLNDRQLEAVTYTEGPLLVLAGAGSGKTRVLTYRIAYLIEEKHIRPYNILALTFTNKAAREMRERIDGLVVQDAFSIWVATFHGFCARLLSNEIERLGYKRSFVIYDENDQQALLGHIIKDLKLNDKVYSKKFLSTTFSDAKNHSLHPLSFLRENAQPQPVLDAFLLYQKRLKESNALDFDDLLLLTIDLFERFPEVLEQYRDRCRYILVDEYQDTNLAQYRIVELLASEHRNLCVVGDDDQSIYGWRGADVRNILEFEKDFKGAKVVRLEQNYRSTAPILEIANKVIEHNEGRKKKTLWTAKQGGENVELYVAEDERAESAFICSTIWQKVRQGARYDDFAVLYRTHAQSRNIEMQLKSFQLPYRVYGGLSFFSRAEVKDVLAYLRLIHNASDDEAFLRIVNVPRRGIGDTSVETLRQNALQRGLPLFAAICEPEGLQEKLVKKFAPFIKAIMNAFEQYGSIPLSKLTEQLLDEIGYDAYLADDKKESYEARADVVNELMNYIGEFEQQGTAEDDLLASFLQNVALFSQADNIDESSGTVKLMTLHAAKGLEFPTVFLCGMEDRLFPSERSRYDPAKMEEERRLCYVGVTRARQKLYITLAKRRMLYGEIITTQPSPFIDEMGLQIEEPKELRGGGAVQYSSARPQRQPTQSPSRAQGTTISGAAAYTPPQPKAFACERGDRVRHKTFGNGMVEKTEGGGAGLIVTILFDNGIRKKFAAAYAPLEKTEV